MGTLYSLQWAIEVVLDFHRNNARATDLCAQVLGFTLKDMVEFARHRGSSWNNFKRCVKVLGSYLRTTPLQEESSQKLELLIRTWAHHVLRCDLVRNCKVLDRLKAVCSTYQVPKEGFLSEVTNEGTQLILDFGV